MPCEVDECDSMKENLLKLLIYANVFDSKLTKNSTKFLLCDTKLL